MRTHEEIVGEYPSALRRGLGQEHTLRQWPIARIRPKSVALGVRSLLAEVDVLRARVEGAEADRDRWKEIAEHPEAARAVPGRQMGDDRA